MKRAAFFPGQGSQSVGMGKAFYDEFTVFRQAIEEASDSLHFDLKNLIFNGPDADLTLTQNAQPAILAVSVGCFRVAETELDFKSDVNLGHSLGEYSALVCSEALPFSQSVRWVNARGMAMQKAVPLGAGTMSAVLGAEDQDVDTWCKEATQIAIAARSAIEESEETAHYSVACTVEPANFNAPLQVVVSGSIDAVSALEALILEKGIRGILAKRLSVSAPFHCSLMKPARDHMDAIFAAAKAKNLLLPLQTPYIPNRTGRLTEDSGLVFPLLSEQVDHSVLWKQSVEEVLKLNIPIAFEFGPGKVLQGLAKRISKGTNKPLEVFPIYDLESLKIAEGVLTK